MYQPNCLGDEVGIYCIEKISGGGGGDRSGVGVYLYLQDMGVHEVNYEYNACNSRSALTSHLKNILITKRGVLYTTLQLSCMGPDHRVHTEWQ